jgi:hypothetical protein
VDEDTLDRWRRRFERAASLLSGRLDDPPTLAELASAAAVSALAQQQLFQFVEIDRFANVVIEASGS